MATKFQPLTDFLRSCDEGMISLSFGQIEGLVGSKLPKSAHDYDAYWEPARSHSIAHAYLRAGYVKVSVSRTAGVLKLRRAPSEAAAILKRHGVRGEMG